MKTPALRLSALLLSALLLSALLFQAACTVTAEPNVPLKAMPEPGKRWLLVGQDWDALTGYSGSNCCPMPGGVTTYLNFYALRDANNQVFGGLGWDNEEQGVQAFADWGGGQTNAYITSQQYPGSLLSLGLSLDEGNLADGLAQIDRGDFDAEIDKLGRFIAQHPSPVLLRIGYEFDGSWNLGYANQERYKAAFRRIAIGVRAQADNVDIVWQGSSSPADEVIDGGFQAVDGWYPGNDVVDWVGLSWFLPPEQQGFGGSSSQRALADELLTFAAARNKPVMIAESAPQGFDLRELTRANIGPVIDGPAAKANHTLSAEQIWQLWYQPFFDYIAEHQAQIRAVAYINVRWDDQGLWAPPYASGYWGDSRVEAQPEILKRWLAEIDQPNWQHAQVSLAQ
ncbi:glycoside hydrolase family 26 protein [Ferrimonas marina]|uniref:GH26 domain-containing protein n=1 Tax=Ferrimonas marina TaxID=299255 RepID=A0A1M5ND38_9GAMM|nr:hypothetical protein [Ferrimonas marina]SHG87382.1 hypothetical protein SAMN02745129_0999 [Ferrimonas marina]